MALEVGSRLAHYDVTALIGEGGMGEVYQATDTKLKRQVALKILPEAFSADPERLARFQREAEVLASLNHPNIAAIHGLEEADDTRALVLELVEGPTLADRIKRGPILLDEALPIAKQIAEALEAAHEAGVIHRDLKPANIKVRDDGTVKVLDFGLAKALDPSPTGDPSQSPTLTAAATQMGMIMGTAAYMSPEQARGKPVDKRADIWAFGCVLYEMLTGKRAFEGEDVSVTLANVINKPPEWKRLPDEISPSLQKYLQRCLEKDPTRRVQAIGDVRLAMDGAFETPVRVPSEDATSRARVIGIAAASAVLAGFACGLAVWYGTRPAAEPSRWLSVTSPPGALVARPVLSPDGETIAFAATHDNRIQVYLRSLSQPDATPLRGSEGMLPESFSPDGQSILVRQARAPATMMRMPVVGGPPTRLAAQEQAAGASWRRDDAIVMGSNNGLMLIPASGGEPRQLTQLSEGELAHGRPRFLPGGQAILFSVWTGDLESSQVALYDLDIGAYRTLLPGTSPRVRHKRTPGVLA